VRCGWPFPLDEADDLGHGVLRGNGKERLHVIWHIKRPSSMQLSFCAANERKTTKLRDKHHMLFAVPLSMAYSLTIWHDKLPLGGTVIGSPEGVCRVDSWNCQTMEVPRPSREFTLM